MLQNFTLYVETDYQAMSKKAAEIFAGAVKANPNGAFGFATGSTPEGMYAELTRMHKNGEVNLSGIKGFNLDEYYPIRKNDPNSYYSYMRKHLYDAVGLPPENAFIPNGEAEDPIKECTSYEIKLYQSGGIDTQILGIGTNGHIGFNEPAEGLHPTTVYVPLAMETIESNSKNFASQDDIPFHAITMGMHSIMMAKRIILLASGVNKANIMHKALYGPITTQVPASLLQLHRDVTVITDSQAASLI